MSLRQPGRMGEAEGDRSRVPSLEVQAIAGNSVTLMNELMDLGLTRFCPTQMYVALEDEDSITEQF